jgi:membrane protease YdiL (CAAX protease family)
MREKPENSGDGRLTAMKLEGRYLVGVNAAFPQKIFEQPSVQALRQGSVDQRLRFVVLANELAGPAVALKELARLDQEMAQYQVQPTVEQSRLRNLLGRLYQDYQHGLWTAPALTAADRTLLRNKLDWFGDLALAPAGNSATGDGIAFMGGGAATVVILAQSKAPDPEQRNAVLGLARRTVVVFIATLILMLLVGLAGFVGLIVLSVFVLTGKVKGLQTGTGRGGIYAETFAVWMILFVALSLVVAIFFHDGSHFLHGGFMLLSLAALAWPVLRGIPWKSVREDLGLTLGRNPLLEPIIGLGCYAMALPLVATGLVVTLILLQAQRNMSEGTRDPFAPSDVPSHPIVEQVPQGGWPDLLGILFLASVAAPLIEETMFRGVLYRHLREASARFGPVLSFFASGILVSFVFAVIHPQGIFGVPVLMALAFGFAMAREWRGTLVPAMVGHAFNNGIVTLILAAALGD